MDIARRNLDDTESLTVTKIRKNIIHMVMQTGGHQMFVSLYWLDVCKQHIYVYMHAGFLDISHSTRSHSGSRVVGGFKDNFGRLFPEVLGGG